MSRYRTRRLLKNNDESYATQVGNRKVNFIRHYSTPVLTYPTTAQLIELTIVNRIWKTGDKFYKLANTFYADPEYWWIIPWFNKKPLETDYAIGSIISIPLPLEKILTFYRV